jgi:hypothetical protein
VFDHLDDPNPPAPRPGAFAAVVGRGRHHRRRRAALFLGAPATVVLLFVGIAGLRPSHPVKVASGPGPTTTTPSTTTPSTTAPAALAGPPAPVNSAATATTARPARTTTTRVRPWRDGVKARPQHAAIRLTAILAKDTIRSGETVSGTLRAENTSDADIDITHPWRCEIDFGIWKHDSFYEDTQPEYEGGWDRASVDCGTQPVTDTIGPHQVRTWPFTLDTLSGFPDSHAAPEPRRPLPPGTYDATAGLWLQARGGVWYALPVPLTIK